MKQHLAPAGLAKPRPALRVSQTPILQQALSDIPELGTYSHEPQPPPEPLRTISSNRMRKPSSPNTVKIGLLSIVSPWIFPRVVYPHCSDQKQFQVPGSKFQVGNHQPFGSLAWNLEPGTWNY